MEPTRNERLSHVTYEIRGKLFELAEELERKGHKITRLNIGNPAAFGFDVPDEIVQDIIQNIRSGQGYCDSRGLFAARKAIEQYAHTRELRDISADDVYIGNGVSELILLSMQALLNPGDEVLVPAPDYPLWTAAVNLSGGKPVHYLCDPAADWQPDLQNIRSKLTPRTRGIVLINPNNPTGAVYPPEILQQIAKIAEEHGIAVFSDEIYDKILYDGAEMCSIGRFVADTLCVTFGGLSKNYRAAGFRAGWMVLSGDRRRWKSYIEGLNLLASMRLCSNVLAQLGIQTALGGDQSIHQLVLPEGRLRKQRDLCFDRLSRMPGISVWRPRGALYLFPKIDLKRLGFASDFDFCLELLREKKVLTVQGSGFNWPTPDRFRIVFLPHVDELEDSLGRMEDFCRERDRG